MKKNKFSIIVPVHNTEKYLTQCLDSIINQSYKNHEIIVVNDGSKGDCKSIVSKYKSIIYLEQENQGLSQARNNGVKRATGDYILFLDSDDYLDSDLLWVLNKETQEEDIIRFQLRIKEEDHIINYYEKGFEKCSGLEAFNLIMKYHFIENAPLYSIKREYWQKNKYSFAPNKYHEDFGLIPQVIFCADKVKSIDYVGYNYIQRENSIMSTKDEKKIIKKAYDVLELGLNEIEIIKNFSSNEKYKKIFHSFVANSIFIKAKELPEIAQKKYIDEIRKNNLLDYLLDDTIKRRIKKRLYKLKYKL